MSRLLRQRQGGSLEPSPPPSGTSIIYGHCPKGFRVVFPIFSGRAPGKLCIALGDGWWSQIPHSHGQLSFCAWPKWYEVSCVIIQEPTLWLADCDVFCSVSGYSVQPMRGLSQCLCCKYYRYIVLSSRPLMDGVLICPDISTTVSPPLWVIIYIDFNYWKLEDNAKQNVITKPVRKWVND